MNIDFSRVNIHYLIQARDLARMSPEQAMLLLGITRRHAGLLAELPGEVIANMAALKMPLLVPRQANWWWMRLLRALADGRPGELERVLEHAALGDHR